MLELIDKLDPNREPGRLTFITRMGAGKIRDALPPLLEAIKAQRRDTRSGSPTRCTATASRRRPATRRAASTTSSTRSRASSRRTARRARYPGGIHIELTGDDVTECLGGSEHIDEATLATRYESLCDPRLNHMQSLELAFLVAEELTAF